MKIISLLWLAFVLSVAGCATNPMDFQPIYVATSTRKIDAILQHITVTTAGSDEQISELPSSEVLHEIIPKWEQSLSDSMRATGAFKMDSKDRVNLVVTILELKIHRIGFSKSTDVTARYEILNSTTGRTVYKNQFSSQGVVPAGLSQPIQGFSIRSGYNHSIESVNMAIRENIEKFLRSFDDMPDLYEHGD